MADARDDFFRLLIRKLQSPKNLLRHVRAHFFVAVEMDFARRRIALRRHRLGDIVQQHRPGQRLAGARRKFFEHQAKVIEHAAFGMIIRRLLAMNRRREFRQNGFQQSAVTQQHQTARGGRHDGWLAGWMAGWLGRAGNVMRVFPTNPFIH